jgi:uncharacterized protein (DUF433 family)
LCIVEVGGEKIGRLQATELPMENQLLQRITLDLNICHGKPCLRGLRYPVEFILELLSSGMSIEDILADYDDLEREDILAALLFATRLTQLTLPSLSCEGFPVQPVTLSTKLSPNRQWVVCPRA